MTTNGGQQQSIVILQESTRPYNMVSKGKRKSSNSAFSLLVVALLSGIVCYRLGMFAGCASPWLNSIDATHSSSLAPSNEGSIDQDDPDNPQYYKSSRRNTFDPNDRRSISRTSLPYDCGVVFFYHIPCTGGASINRWFQRYKRPELGNISYYQHWQPSAKGGIFHSEPEKCEANFAKGMNKHIQNLGPNEWRIAHSHLTSTYLNESEDLLYKWRSDVEAQGCQLINTIMLRDPLNHAMSLHKIIKSKNSTKAEWATYLSSPTGDGKWATVLDFFLYNLHGLRYHDDYPNGPGGRNPFNVTKEVKVARALELLHRHFDIVTVADHATFMGKILNYTGWTPVKMPYSNVHKGVLNFTKKEVETLQKGLLKNGDLDFVDQVKYEYHDHLSYLNN
mmetsp:Transcript_28003/g.51652  ORF Transcript_28003/g.51652 Transcript_28003/m.51652 type:complete len:392 (-) Transcript_28003:88-1263(-)